MVRKSSIYILLISFLLLVPGPLLSLGLGEIEVDSVLNQPLSAQINLISARADELEEMRVELAPANVFDRVGVPRPYFLTQLKFKPVSLPGGGTAIRITTKDHVREPFLTFLVEVTWPKGRLLREYTVLLDPPEFAQQQAPQIATPVTAPVPEEQIAQAEPVMTPQAELITGSENDIEAVRAQMDRELGIDASKPIANIEVEIVEATPVIEEVVEETVMIEPTAEQLEEAVAETVEESQSVAEDVSVSEEMNESELQDLESIRAQMDKTLGIEGTEPVEAVDNTDSEVVADADTEMQASLANQHNVARGDTLFKIAKSAREPSAVTINQMMIAIQQANPNAFSRNNINILKKGAVLRIPDAGEAQAISTADARQKVSQQNALWREYLGNVSQVAATNVDAPELVKEKSTVAEQAKQALKETIKKPEAAKQDLNILAADDGKNSQGNTQVAGGEELKKLQSEITLNKEIAESKAKESEELRSRVEALESMLEKKEKILNIQNQQLKDLQQQLSTEADKAAAAEKMLQENSAKEEPKPEVTPAVKPVEKAVVQEIKKPVVEPLPEFKEPVVVEQTISKPRLEPLPDWNSLPEIEPLEEVVAEAKPAEKPAEVKPEQKPTEVTPAEVQTSPEAKTGLVAGLLGFLDSLNLKKHAKKAGIGFGILAALLGLILWLKKRSYKTIELTGLGEMPLDTVEDDEHFDDILDETIVTPQSNATAEVSNDVPGTMEDLGLDDEDTGFDSISEEALGDGEDVLDEADVYISYGLHQQAHDLLTDAIAKESDNNEYKAKLAEVYYSQKDQQGFEQYAEKIKNEVGESSAQWQNIMAMGKELAPSEALFAGAAAVDATAFAAADKPDAADVDIGLQTVIDNPLSDANLEDTIVDNDALGSDDTEQFDASNMDTEFLDPAEQTVAQTHTDLEELGPPSLIEEVGTKLDLAKAFVDMGDSDDAKETLLEVINEGDESQIKAAKDLMDKLGS